MEGLFEQYMSGKEPSVAEEICVELAVHTAVEEEVINPLLGSEVRNADDLRRHAEEEHLEVSALSHGSSSSVLTMPARTS